MKNLFKNTKIVVLLSTIVVALITVLAYLLFIMPKPVVGEKNLTLKINYSENNYEYSLTTNGDTVIDVLNQYNDIYELKLVTESSAYGEFITSLKGVRQDEEKGYYYTYTLNGGYADGISTQTVKDGDVLEFNYVCTVYDENWNVVSQTFGGKGETASYVKIAIIAFSIAGVILVAGVCYFLVQYFNEKSKKVKK